MIRRFLVSRLWFLVGVVAVVWSSAPVFADRLDDETREIAKLLQCPVCQNVSVADSNSDLAQQMRGIIRRKLEAGESREAIVAYFVDRYGETVLVAPPKAGFMLGIWLGPIIGLAVGGFLVYAAYRSRRAPPAPPPADEADDDADDAALAEDLRRYREGTSR